MQETSALYREILSGPYSTEVRLAVGETGKLITKSGESISFGGTSILIGSTGAEGGYDESLLISVRREAQLFSGDDIALGSCVSSELSVTMLKPLGEVPRKARLVPYVRIVNESAKSEWFQKGVFYVDTRDIDTDGSGVEYLRLEGYDSMLLAEQDYPSSTLSWPAKDIDVVREIAAFLDVPVDTRTFELLNKGYLIQYPAGYSCRDTLGYIASMYAGCFIMSDVGELRLVPFYGIPKETRYLVTRNRQSITFGGDRILV